MHIRHLLWPPTEAACGNNRIRTGNLWIDNPLHYRCAISPFGWLLGFEPKPPDPQSGELTAVRQSPCNPWVDSTKINIFVTNLFCLEILFNRSTVQLKPLIINQVWESVERLNNESAPKSPLCQKLKLWTKFCFVTIRFPFQKGKPMEGLW